VNHLVRDLMRESLLSCPPGTTLGQAAAMLARHRIHALVITDATGQAQGVLSDMDLLAGEWLSADPASLEAMRTMTANELKSTPAVTIDAGARASEAAARMQAEHVHRLIVTEMGRAVGVISVSDVVASLGQSALGRRTVAEAMTRGIVVCREDAPVSAAARAMTERRSRSIVVVNADGRPQGIVTGFDLLPLCESGDTHQPVAQLMHAPITIHPDATLQQAADLMLKHHVHRLVVVDPAHPDGIPLGLVSTSDIVAEMAAPGSVWQTAAG